MAGTNAVRRLPSDINPNAMMSGSLRPFRSATIEKPTAVSDTARTMANTMLMFPSVKPRDSLA